MTNINFVDELNLFMRYARNNQLTSRERLLWIALFWIANDRAIYNAQAKAYEWPTDFFPVPNGELSLNSTLDKRGIENVRNSLKQKGLIDFHPGCRNKRPAEYQIHYLSKNVGYKIVPNDVPNNVPKDVPNNVPKDVPNNVPRSAPFIDIDIDQVPTRSNDSNFYDGDDAGAGAGKAIDGFFQEYGMDMDVFLGVDDAVKQEVSKVTDTLFRKMGGRAPTAADESYVFQETRELVDGKWVNLQKDRLQLLAYCFQEAVKQGCPGNWRYISGCMRNLERRGITSLVGIEDYEDGGFVGKEWMGSRRMEA